MTAPVSALEALTRAFAEASDTPDVITDAEAAERIIAVLATAGYRIEPEDPSVPRLTDMAITDMVAWLLERRAEFHRQATNAPRDSVEQLAARDTADALGEVAHAITERWVKL